MWNDHSPGCQWALTGFVLLTIVGGLFAVFYAAAPAIEGAMERRDAKAAQGPLKLYEIGGCEYVGPRGFRYDSHLVHHGDCKNHE